jgi:hypothetical protein
LIIATGDDMGHEGLRRHSLWEYESRPSRHLADQIGRGRWRSWMWRGGGLWGGKDLFIIATRKDMGRSGQHSLCRGNCRHLVDQIGEVVAVVVAQRDLRRNTRRPGHELGECSTGQVHGRAAGERKDWRCSGPGVGDAACMRESLGHLGGNDHPVLGHTRVVSRSWCQPWSSNNRHLVGGR